MAYNMGSTLQTYTVGSLSHGTHSHASTPSLWPRIPPPVTIDGWGWIHSSHTSTLPIMRMAQASSLLQVSPKQSHSRPVRPHPQRYIALASLCGN
ncbi:unspecified product [Leishmania tarentolae]|uniref:Unspecified product n=1 Tax=Leishmania tarentolae TaxID=5689 RepID=A0A640KJC8_LEITA|nr:unspecified product [Leishmania tarentolae]